MEILKVIMYHLILSTTVNNKIDSKINSNNIKPNVKSTITSVPPLNPSLFQKNDNTAAAAAATNGNY